MPLVELQDASVGLDSSSIGAKIASQPGRLSASTVLVWSALTRPTAEPRRPHPERHGVAAGRGRFVRASKA